MEDRRIVIFFSMIITAALVAVSSFLLISKADGTAEFSIFGQNFSSSNIGLAVLFVAVMSFLIILKQLFGNNHNPKSSSKAYATAGGEEFLDWNDVFSGIRDLVLQLTASSGFRPDLVIGICGGGLVIADIVSKRLGHVPCLSIWPNRHTSNHHSAFSGQALAINRIQFDQIIAENAINRILVVDDVVYSGSTLKDALEFLNESSASIRQGTVEIRSATLFSLTTAEYRPDFSVYSHSSHRRMMPVSDRLRQ
ncbi:phosphoribosyltransferase [Minwuia sp.]|uniref:phosphoribosyltransferase n=1 Tax=Minwuia sp. TaxID=2493630 RepID=UPI003A8E40F2